MRSSQGQIKSDGELNKIIMLPLCVNTHWKAAVGHLHSFEMHPFIPYWKRRWVDSQLQFESKGLESSGFAF